MKYNYSYFVIKPDGIRYFPEIYKELEGKFDNIRYYKLDNFSSLIKKLYFRNFEKKGQKLVDSFEQYLYASESIFGNEAILAIVSDKDEKNAQEFRQKVFDLKMKIRDTYSNNNIGVISNYATNNKKNFVKIVDEDGNIQKQMMFNDDGSYRISFFNVIHSPDPDLKSTVEELSIICKSDVLDESKLLDEERINEFKRFKTTNGFRDRKKYMRPDISTFLKYNIKMNNNEKTTRDDDERV